MKFNIFNLSVYVSLSGLDICSSRGDLIRRKFRLSLSAKALDSEHASAKRVIAGCDRRIAKGESVDLCERVKARSEAVLAEPNKFLFPNIVSLSIGKNDFGLALNGPNANIPAIARKYGYMEPACGNGYVYNGILGSHIDL